MNRIKPFVELEVKRKMENEKHTNDIENEFAAFDGKSNFKLPDDYMNQLKNQVKKEVPVEKEFSLLRRLLPIVAAACVVGFLFSLFPSSSSEEVVGFEEITLADIDWEDLSEEDLGVLMVDEEIQNEEEDLEAIELYLLEELDDVSIIEEELFKCIKC